MHELMFKVPKQETLWEIKKSELCCSCGRIKQKEQLQMVFVCEDNMTLCCRNDVEPKKKSIF